MFFSSANHIERILEHLVRRNKEKWAKSATASPIVVFDGTRENTQGIKRGGQWLLDTGSPDLIKQVLVQAQGVNDNFHRLN